MIRGEPGVGKTTLVEYAVRSADDLQVVYLTGVESERELGYAALHRLLTPILKRIDKLPEAQRVAMEAAFGLGPRASTDRFMIGLATVTLAAESASFRPLLCVIDDAQWVDRESIDALAFWGRRLHAERCALLFAERSILGVASPLDAFPVLELGGLAEAEAYALLATHAVSGLDRDVAGRLVAETSGNPLALIELAKSLTGDQLSGAVLLPDPMPLGRHLEEHFLRQVRALPAETQLMLLLAATDPTGDPVLLAHAAERQGVPEDAAITAEAAGHVSLLPRVRFRHPLVRSAIYSGAQAADRRRAHATLAAVTDETIYPVRRAWHLANAAASPDEAVAMLLERTAQLAQERGGRPAEAAFLKCAADLTPDRDRAAERRVGAAEAALAAGSAVQAQEILDLALPDLRDPYLRAQADRLLGISWMLQGRTSVASTVLFEAALAARPFDATMSRWTMLEAFEAACLSGGQGVSWRDIAREAMNDLDAASDRVPIVDDLLAAMATGLTTDYVAAVPFLRRAVGALATEDVPMADALRWSMLGSFAARALWDQDAHETIVQRLATISRADGALRWLQLALRGCATAELWSGRFGRADTYSEEANEISAATDSRFPLSGLTDIDVLAWKGRNKKARIRADTTLGLSEEDGMGASRTIVAMALTVLDLADGNYDDALRHARAVFDEDLILFSNQILSDMVEAAVRAGDADAAKLALDRLGVRAPASGERVGCRRARSFARHGRH